MGLEDQGQDSEVEITEENSLVEQEPQQQTEEHENGYNPVFEPIRQELGLQFESIKPHLLEIEKGFNSGITKANSKYDPWKQFDEQGITPDAVTQGFATLQRINDDPVGTYQALHKFLEENGRLPETQAEVKQAIDEANEEDDLLSDSDKKIAELQQKLEEQQQFLQAQAEKQEMEQLNARMEQSVAQEFDAFEKAHPELTDEDRQEIYQRHFQYAASGPQNIRSLEDVAKEYLGLVNRIRSAPRPNDSAPRLLGSGGGVPTGQRKPVDQLSREESQDMLAELLRTGKK